MSSWYEDVMNMPEDVRAIALYCWDETGRPLIGNTRNVAIGRLLDLCDTFDQFSIKYRKLFPAGADKMLPDEIENEIQTCWHMYFKGLLRATTSLEKEINEQVRTVF